MEERTPMPASRSPVTELRWEIRISCNGTTRSRLRGRTYSSSPMTARNCRSYVERLISCWHIKADAPSLRVPCRWPARPLRRDSSRCLLDSRIRPARTKSGTCTEVTLPAWTECSVRRSYKLLTYVELQGGAIMSRFGREA